MQCYIWGTVNWVSAMFNKERNHLTTLLTCPTGWLQEAFKCWSCLVALVLCNSANAVSNGIGVLVTPMLKKVIGSGSELVQVSGVLAPNTDASKFDTPLTKELSMQVCDPRAKG